MDEHREEDKGVSQSFRGKSGCMDGERQGIRRDGGKDEETEGERGEEIHIGDTKKQGSDKRMQLRRDG